MIETCKVRVPAPSGEQERTAYVYLPKGYGKETYPVLHMFDGQTLFFDERAPYGESWRMGEVLDALGAQLIVAAVECDEKDRLTEYSPFPFASKFGSSEGKGKVYMDWLTERFVPDICGRYAVDPARQYIAGSSMGGLMTLYALCNYPVFAGGAALSPSLWVDPARCREMIDGCKMRPTVYLDYGEKELAGHGEQQREALEMCLGALIGKGIPTTFRLIEGGTHSERSWRAQIPIFLKALGLL